MTAILDWLGNEIKCPEEIEEALSSKSKVKKEFYQSYVFSLEEIVGFMPEKQLFEGIKDVRSWTELFNKIEREFNQQSFLKRVFNNSYAQFFNSFFVYPYGVHYQDGKDGTFVDVLNESATKDKDKNEKNRKILGYVRGINLPLLLLLSLRAHPLKYEELLSYNELLGKEKCCLTYQQSENVNLEGVLRAEFGSNPWHNFLSNFDDCIFISHDKEQEKVIFQDYWFASLLHTLHPKVHYLNFVVTEGKELKELYPYPLLKAILIETGQEHYPLLLEGVVGANLNKFRVDSETHLDLRDFADFSVWQLFRSKFQSENPERELLYFPFHSEKKNKPYFQFDEQTKRKYREGCNLKPKLFLSVPYDQETIRLISNRGTLTNEQFSEAFAFSNTPKDKKEREKRVGGLVNLEGRMQGLGVKEYVPANRISPFLSRRKKIGLTGLFLAGCALAGAWGYLQTRPLPCFNTIITEKVEITCNLEEKKVSFFPENIKIINQKEEGVVIEDSYSQQYELKFDENAQIREFLALNNAVFRYKEFLSKGEPCRLNANDYTSVIHSIGACTNSARAMLRMAHFLFDNAEKGLRLTNSHLTGLLLGYVKRNPGPEKFIEILERLSDPAVLGKLKVTEEKTARLFPLLELYSDYFFGLTIRMDPSLLTQGIKSVEPCITKMNELITDEEINKNAPVSKEEIYPQESYPFAKLPGALGVLYPGNIGAFERETACFAGLHALSEVQYSLNNEQYLEYLKLMEKFILDPRFREIGEKLNLLVENSYRALSGRVAENLGNALVLSIVGGLNQFETMDEVEWFLSLYRKEPSEMRKAGVYLLASASELIKYPCVRENLREKCTLKKKAINFGEINECNDYIIKVFTQLDYKWPLQWYNQVLKPEVVKQYGYCK